MVEPPKPDEPRRKDEPLKPNASMDQAEPLKPAKPLEPGEPRPLAERLKGWLDALLVADVFLVIGAALWFGLAVILNSRKIEAPLQLFERLWQPLFLPAISLLMAAAIVSGVLGWWRRRGQP